MARARSQGWSAATAEDLARSYRAGDPVARAAVSRSATAVGEAIDAAATLFDPEAVAVAGGFVTVADDHVTQVRTVVRESGLHEYARTVHVTTSGLDGDGPLIGAGDVVLRWPFRLLT